MNKAIYFASDFHLGIPDHSTSLVREIKLVRWLRSIQEDAAQIFLMGDLFDFWFEYRTVVPKGYSRLLGTIADITDSGIPVHLFRGNHDMWAFRYLEQEIGITLHRDPEFMTFEGTHFYLAHGDGLGPGDHGYKLLKYIFSCRINQILFNWIHPDLGIRFALYWSHRSRSASIARQESEEDITKRLIEQRITTHSRIILQDHPEVDYLIYGHYHFPIATVIGDHSLQVVLGDWLTHFTYARFDGKELKLMPFTDTKKG